MSKEGSGDRTKIIGIGNDIRSDDGVGLHVIRALKPLLLDHPSIELIEIPWGGLRLMEHMTGCDRAIVVDAMHTGADPGTLRWLDPGGLPTYHSGSSHDLTLPTALALGRLNEADLPRDEQIEILGIEVEDVETYSEDLTPSVEAAVPQAVGRIMEHLGLPEPHISVSG